VKKYLSTDERESPRVGVTKGRPAKAYLEHIPLVIRSQHELSGLQYGEFKRKKEAPLRLLRFGCVRALS
jgi:hypothetical protein